jgi:nucleotide-binding universal stress UspA family protein
MKTILVGIDFSRSSSNALNYAAELAKSSRAKLVLFHVYSVTIIPTEAPVVYPTYSVEEMEKDALKKLLRIRQRLYGKYSKRLKIECVANIGFAVEETLEYSIKSKCDFIVIGMEDYGYLSEQLLGSTSTTIIKRAKKPVLLINKKVKFEKIKRILLACDYKKDLSKAAVDSIKDFARIFKSKVLILNVEKSKSKLPLEMQAVRGIKLEHSMEEVRHEFHFVSSDDVVSAINRFIQQEEIDLVMMFPQTHSAVYNIIHEPNSKRMAFHTSIPLLTVHL